MPLDGTDNTGKPTNFLDELPQNWERQELHTLRDLFVEAYQDQTLAKGIADAAGILVGTFPLHNNNMQTTWRELIETMGKQGKLRKLVEKAADDPTISGYRKRFVEMLKVNPSAPASTPSRDDNWWKTDVNANSPHEFPTDQQYIAPNNIPLQPTAFIDREDVLVAIKEMVRDKRLVTLVGIGGCGKSRIAIEAANHLIASELFPNGICFVSLAPLTSGDLVPQTVAKSIRGVEIADLPEQLTSRLIRALKTLSLLLILDNCEHLLDAVARLTHNFLTECPRVRILATSRVKLSINGEHLYDVPVLSLPKGKSASSEESVLASESGSLFVDRARAASNQFVLTPNNVEDVASICRRLEGIPLAIELAAANVRELSVNEIAKGLNLALLENDDITREPRQRSMEASIEWSFRLLSKPQQEFLARLSVFVGGWSANSAATVCNVTSASSVRQLLSALVKHALIVADTSGRVTRYRMVEPIREFSSARLSEQQLNETRHQHLKYFTAFMEEHHEAAPLRQDELYTAIDEETNNLWGAVAWAETEATVATAGLKLLVASYWYFRRTVQIAILKRAFTILLAKDKTAEPLVQAKAHSYLASLNWRQGDTKTAIELYKKAYKFYVQCGETEGAIHSLLQSGMKEAELGNYDAGIRDNEDGMELAREKYPRLVALGWNHLGEIDRLRGRYDTALICYKNSRQGFAAENDLRMTGVVLYNMGVTCWHLNENDECKQYFLQGAEILLGINDSLEASFCLLGLAGYWANKGQFEKAWTLFIVSEGILHSRQASVTHVDRQYHDEIRAKIEEHLDTSVRLRAFEYARRLNPAEALELAR